MTNINMSSILNKAKKCITQTNMQKKIENIVDGVFLGETGSHVHETFPGAFHHHTTNEAATKFIEVLQNEIESLGVSDDGDFSSGNLGSTAVSALTKLNHGTPIKVGKYKYLVEIYFAEDLHRDSLVPDKYDGIDNIAALLNSGYKAGNAVYGIWSGHNSDQPITSLTRREGAHFIESAIRNFMANYAAEYGVIEIGINDAYK